MNIQERLRLRFLRTLVATKEGRAHLLHQIADAEGTDEGKVFEHLLAKVDDPKLKQLIEKHKSDELRHEALFRACAERTGATVPPAPSELHMLERLDAALDHFFTRPIEGDRGVMEAYLILQVIEERAMSQFALFEAVFREVDPETADVFAEVGRDEARHLKYCLAISRRYAPDEETRLETLAKFREVEARAFADNGRANFRYVTERGYFQAGWVEMLMWRALTAMQGSAPATVAARAELAAA